MFSEMVESLAKGILPEPTALGKRFDIAVTKKLGVVRLPAAFWMDDPKINPRSDHLLWAALLTLDRERIELALAVLAAELNEKKSSGGHGFQEEMRGRTQQLIGQFFDRIQDERLRREMRRELERIIPEWIEASRDNSDD